MRLLCFDTSTPSGALCAVEVDGFASRTIASLSESVQIAQHSERLLQLVDRLLGEAGWTLSEIEAFAVGRGPGSFTGIRIGLATARTFGQLLDIPLIPFSSLEAWMNSVDQLAEGGIEPDWRLVVSEATQGEVYLGIGQLQHGHFVERLEVLSDWSKLPELIEQFFAGVGVVQARLIHTPAAPRFRSMLANHYPISLVSGPHAEELTPRGVAASTVFAQKSGIQCSFRDATPVYLRVSDAEKKRVQ